MNEADKGGIGLLFLYVGVAIALLFTVVFGVRAVFSIIDHVVLHDSVSWYGLNRSTEMPISTAFLLVSFTSLFIILRRARSIGVDAYQDTVWHMLCRAIILIIATVSVSMVAVSVSLFLGDLLSGDVSLNGSLKEFFVAGVGAVVFYYYRGVLQGVWRDRKKEEKVFVSVISAVVILVVIVAGVLSDPLDRPQREDTYEKLATVEHVYHSVEVFYHEEERLPESLDFADFSKGGYRFPVGSQDDVSYKVVDGTSFQICVLLEALPRGTAMKDYPYARFEVERIGENCFAFSL